MQRSETKPLTSEKSWQLPDRLGRTLIWGGLLLLAVWLVVKIGVMTTAVRSLLAYQSQAETMMADGISHLSGAEVEAMVFGVRDNVATLKNESAFLMPLTPHLGWVPRVGSTLEIAPHLLEMADAGTETAAYAVRGLSPALDLLGDDSATSDQLPTLIQVVGDAKPDIIAAGASLQRVTTARSAIGTPSALPDRVQTLLALSDTWLPVAQDGLRLLTVLPELAGIDGQKQYLLMAQNEDERRATGGFITGAGLLTLDNGRFSLTNFEDAYRVDDFNKPYGDPPARLYDLMGLELFLFRDANFWPDFPTSAEQAMNLYSYGRSLPPLDGAIAIDQQFLQKLLLATGPVTIPDSDLRLTSNNVIISLQNSWGQPDENGNWIGNRKSFLGPFATAIQQKLLGDLGQVDLVALVTQMHQAASDKHLQIYMRDPQVAATLDAINWDGRLEKSPNADYLLVVDTNMSFNKANLLIERQTSYAVTLDASGTAAANLAIAYRHNGAPLDKPCLQDEVATVYATAPDYQTLANLCYFNYLRVYTADGVTLQSASESDIAPGVLVTDQPWQSGAQTAVDDLVGWHAFENLWLLPSGETAQVALQYTVPNGVQTLANGRSQYTLTLAKQAGVASEPVTVQITLPQNATFISASTAPATLANNQLTFDLTLTTDTTLSVVYQP